MSQREKEQHREQENKIREHQEAQQRMREFNDFKFNVDLEYKDEFGHEMSKKDVPHLSYSSANVARHSSDSLMLSTEKPQER